MSRYHSDVEYPKLVYLEMAACFFAANFVYHKNIFRRNQNKLAFGGFVLINAFTSYALCEAGNPQVAKYYAALYNNKVENDHRARLNYILRTSLWGPKAA